MKSPFKFTIKKQKSGRYTIKDIEEDDMRFLRDLMGRFADNPGDGGIKRHFHTHLFVKIDRALSISMYQQPMWKITAHDTPYGSVLHSTLNKD